MVRTVLVSGQLLGHRGLVSLPEDWVYHDNLTLTVSKSAGKLAKELEVREKHRESERKVLQLQRRERVTVPRYDQQESQENLLGQEVAAQSVLAYGDSLSLQPVQNTRLPAKLEELEAERRSGSSARRPPRFPARLKAESRSQTVGQLSAVRPQFQSQPLVGERFNRFYSRYRASQDRSELRARVELRNSLLATQSQPQSQSQPLPFSSTSHLASQQVQPDRRTGFSFNFLVQH